MGRGEAGPGKRRLMRGAHLYLVPSHYENGKPLRLGAYLPGRGIEQSLCRNPEDPEQGHEVGEPRQAAPSGVVHYQTWVVFHLQQEKSQIVENPAFCPITYHDPITMHKGQVAFRCITPKYKEHPNVKEEIVFLYLLNLSG